VQLTFGAAGGQIQPAWPADHRGWHSQTRTNAPGVRLGTNWTTVPNSLVTNQVVVPINPVGGSVFFRLVYP
jgi:hypothetical protein